MISLSAAPTALRVPSTGNDAAREEHLLRELLTDRRGLVVVLDAQDLVVERFGPNPVSSVYVGRVNIENRFRYNQAFKSVFSMVPSVIVIMLALIPAIMATIGAPAEDGEEAEGEVLHVHGTALMYSASVRTRRGLRRGDPSRNRAGS